MWLCAPLHFAVLPFSVRINSQIIKISCTLTYFMSFRCIRLSRSAFFLLIFSSLFSAQHCFAIFACIIHHHSQCQQQGSRVKAHFCICVCMCVRADSSEWPSHSLNGCYIVSSIYIYICMYTYFIYKHALIYSCL